MAEATLSPSEPSKPKAPPSEPVKLPGSPAAGAGQVKTTRCESECFWRGWKDLPGVQVRPGWEKRGEDFFLVAEWKAAPTQRLDVWVWLKDGDGEKAVYPFESRAIGWYNMTTTPEGFRKTFLLPIDLEKGRRYNVAMSVQPYKPGATGPNIKNADVDGLMSVLIFR
ncbi:hypothetical protein [Streptomyces sp. NPDC051079]|uniref:hypothetical protein n=1 Tax=Streptomyces sp. NPDC051079 TaxID=3155043 RepID=UPI00344E4A0A